MKPTFLITDTDPDTLSVLPCKFRDHTVLAVALRIEDRTSFAAIEQLLRKFDAPILIATRAIGTLTERSRATLSLLPDDTQVIVVSADATLAPCLRALSEEAPVTLYCTTHTPATEPLFMAADYHQSF